ncbi:MAG TPA: hypothetical protein VNC79_00555 [Mycobacteriales bacterium]|nr:hypothetical protein [Mycobacteriales bacterium]
MRTFWLAFVPLAGTVGTLAALHAAGIGAASLIVLGAALCLRTARRPAGRPVDDLIRLRRWWPRRRRVARAALELDTRLPPDATDARLAVLAVESGGDPAPALAAARAAVAGLPPYRPVEVVPEPANDRSAAVRAAVRTRLALQSTAALALAFTVGQLAFGRHWPWVVITVLAVSLRATSRGEVAVTTAERLLGALAGTVLATAVAALATPAPLLDPDAGTRARVGATVRAVKAGIEPG